MKTSLHHSAPAPGAHFPCCAPRKLISGSLSPTILEQSRSRELEAPELQVRHVNLPICSEMAHVRNVAHSHAPPFSPQGSANNSCLPPSSFLQENQSMYATVTDTFQQKLLRKYQYINVHLQPIN